MIKNKLGSFKKIDNINHKRNQLFYFMCDLNLKD